jgi:hypothetical protein
MILQFICFVNMLLTLQYTYVILLSDKLNRYPIGAITMTTIDTTEIRYNRETRDYDVLDAGRYITSAASYSQAEAKRMEYLSAEHAHAATTRETMMELADRVNALRAEMKTARGNARKWLIAQEQDLLPELHTAQRAYLAEQRASKQVMI